MGNIQTGVDRLVALVKEKGKIAIDEAAKTLGVSKDNVQEWADFLEEESIIEIKYGLAKTYLVDRKLTKTESVQQERQYEQRRETYVGAVDASIRVPEPLMAGSGGRAPPTSFSREALDIEALKREFLTLKNELLRSVATIHSELRSIHSLERQQAQSVALFEKERIALKSPRKESPRANLQLDDIYWLAHHSINAILAAQGHHPEERLDKAVEVFTHEFLSNAPDLAERWQGLLREIAKARRRHTTLNAEDIHDMFVRCRNLMSDTLHGAVEPVDDFTRRARELDATMTAGDYPSAEQQYRALVTLYEQLPEERKALHYDRFEKIYLMLTTAGNR